MPGLRRKNFVLTFFFQIADIAYLPGVQFESIAALQKRKGSVNKHRKRTVNILPDPYLWYRL